MCTCECVCVQTYLFGCVLTHTHLYMYKWQASHYTGRMLEDDVGEGDRVLISMRAWLCSPAPGVAGATPPASESTTAGADDVNRETIQELAGNLDLECSIGDGTLPIGVEIGLRQLMLHQRGRIVVPATSCLLLCGAAPFSHANTDDAAAGAEEERRACWHDVPGLELPFDARLPAVANSRVVFDIVLRKLLARTWELDADGDGDTSAAVDGSGGGGGGRGAEGSQYDAVLHKVGLAAARKAQGNRLLAMGWSRLAMFKYQSAQYLIEYEETEDSGEVFEEATCEIRPISRQIRDQMSALKVALWLNLASCWQRQGHPSALKAGLRCSNEALELRPRHPKALFRRACLHTLLGDLDLAMADLNAAALLEPGNAQVAKKVREVQALMAEARVRERATWQNVFA